MAWAFTVVRKVFGAKRSMFLELCAGFGSNSSFLYKETGVKSILLHTYSRKIANLGHATNFVVYSQVCPIQNVKLHVAQYDVIYSFLCLSYLNEIEIDELIQKLYLSQVNEGSAIIFTELVDKSLTTSYEMASHGGMTIFMRRPEFYFHRLKNNGFLCQVKKIFPEKKLEGFLGDMCTYVATRAGTLSYGKKAAKNAAKLGVEFIDSSAFQFGKL